MPAQLQAVMPDSFVALISVRTLTTSCAAGYHAYIQCCSKFKRQRLPLLEKVLFTLEERTASDRGGEVT